MHMMRPLHLLSMRLVVSLSLLPAAVDLQFCNKRRERERERERERDVSGLNWFIPCSSCRNLLKAHGQKPKLMLYLRAELHQRL
jgi:hypothetical protein